MTYQLHIGWDRVTSLTIEVKKKVDAARGGWTPKHIVGVSRGGLIPAVMLSHMYKRETVQVIQASSYDLNNKQGDLRVFYDGVAQEVMRSPDTLVIDDILDTGKTFDLIQLTYPKPLFAALLTKRWDVGVISGELVPQNSWIVLPWESGQNNV